MLGGSLKALGGRTDTEVTMKKWLLLKFEDVVTWRRDKRQSRLFQYVDQVTKMSMIAKAAKNGIMLVFGCQFEEW